jgi:hypothetical protein
VVAEDIGVMPLIGERRNEVRADRNVDEGREENDKPLPPPGMRRGMNPARLPPKGMTYAEPPILSAAMENDDAP